MSVHAYDYTFEDNALVDSTHREDDAITTSKQADYVYHAEGQVKTSTGICSPLFTYGPNALASSTHHEDEPNETGSRFDSTYGRAGQVFSETPAPSPSPRILGFGYDTFGNAWSDWSSGSSITRRFFADSAVTERPGADFQRIGVSGDEDWMLNDKLKSIREVVAGDALTRRDWPAYGLINHETGAVSSRYIWTGRESEAEDELEYCHARYYDPTIGRWISEDPIRFAAGDGNLYRYVLNDPVVNTDPTGQFLIARNISVANALAESFKRIGIIATIETSIEHQLIFMKFKGWNNRTTMRGWLIRSQFELPSRFLEQATLWDAEGSHWLVPSASGHKDPEYSLKLGGVFRLLPSSRPNPASWSQAISGAFAIGPFDAYDAARGVDAKMAFRISEDIARTIYKENPSNLRLDRSADLKFKQVEWIKNAARHLSWMTILSFRHGVRDAKSVGDIHDPYPLNSIDSLLDQFHNKLGRERIYDSLMATELNPVDSLLFEKHLRESVISLIRKNEAIVTWNDPRIRLLPGFRDGLREDATNGSGSLNWWSK